MGREIPPLVNADYQDWLRQEHNADEWIPEDPQGIGQAFYAGWRRGAVFVAKAVLDHQGMTELPQVMIDELLAKGDTEVLPGQ